MKYYNNKARQAGMTLIELTVVLLVLIGLAGLMIPYVSGFMSKTHDSTGTNNLARLNSNIARFENQFMRSPDALETLVVTSTGTDPYSKLMNSDMFQVVTVGGNMTTAPGIRAMSLNAAGIQTLISNDDTTDDATFKSTGANTPSTFGMGAALNVAALCGEDSNPMGNANLVGCGNAGAGTTAAADIQDHLVEAFGGSLADYDATCFDYIALGIGDQSEMIGRSMQSAPIHFASNGDMGPTNRYNRFVAVYKVDKENNDGGDVTNTHSEICSTNTEPAKFVGTAMSMMQNHLWGLGHTAGHAYENIAQ